ncbi:MAG TPA: PIN domain-containing protein [Streptosporangiaceae bacterium]|nr:PIN domain-containing protein [Streptosporangiaceae bacterium]
MIVCDTGPLVAAALSNDSDHQACVALFSELHAAGRTLLVPATVVAEVGYLLAREAGPRVESLFLQSLAGGDFSPVDLTTADYSRMGELVITYGDLPLGTTHASVIAIAERLKLTEVATLDRRHFAVVRPTHVNALTLLP